MGKHWHILALGSVLGAAGCYAEHASVQPDGQRKAEKEGSSQPAMCADRLAQVGSTLERVLDAHACRGFKITRRAQAVAGTDGSCENDIAEDAKYNVAALNGALAHPDVVAAREASPVVYGLDTRPWDGSVLHIEIDGDTIEVGSECGAGSDCQVIPDGIAILRSTLEELGVQQRAFDSCKALQ